MNDLWMLAALGVVIFLMGWSSGYSCGRYASSSQLTDDVDEAITKRRP